MRPLVSSNWASRRDFSSPVNGGTGVAEPVDVGLGEGLGEGDGLGEGEGNGEGEGFGVEVSAGLAEIDPTACVVSAPLYELSQASALPSPTLAA